MWKQYKRILNIAKTDALQSFLPIILWYIVGYIYQDRDLSNIFSLTYYFQFVYAIVYDVILVGTVKCTKKNKDASLDAPYSAVITGALIMIGIVIGIGFNTDTVLRYFNASSKYKYFYILALIYLSTDYVMCGISKILQYSDKHDDAFKITVAYHSIRIGSVFIAKIANDIIDKNNYIVSLAVAGTCILTFALYAIIKYCRIHKFVFNCFKGVFIESPSIVYGIMMTVIYFFGLQKAAVGSASFLAAYNISTMCTDTQWDILHCSIDTNTSVQLCDGSFEKNKKDIYKASMLYSLTLFLSSFVLIMICSIGATFDLKAALLMYLIECITFIWYSVMYVQQSWLKLFYSGKFMVLQVIVGYTVRVILTFSINSMYRLNIPVLINSIFMFVTTLIMYKYYRKQRRAEV